MCMALGIVYCLSAYIFGFVGVMYCISPIAIVVCVTVCVYAAFLNTRKRFEIETSCFLRIARNNTGYNL